MRRNFNCVLLACGGLLFGCDRSQTPASQPASPQAGLRPPAPANQNALARELPKIDTRKMPAPVRQQFALLYGKASKGRFEPDTARELGALCLVHGDVRQAIQCFKVFAKAEPDTYLPWYYLGIALEKADQKELAIQTFTKALQQNANYTPIHLRLASLVAPGDRERAAEYFRQALTVQPDDPVANLGLGQLEAAGGRHEQAVELFRKAIAAFPEYQQAHRSLADSLRALGGAEGAAEQERLAQTGGAPPLNDPAYAGLLRWGLDLGILLTDARQHMSKREFDEAEGLLQTAALVDVAGVRARSELAALRVAQGRLEDAAEQYRLALKGDPKDYNARSNLSIVLLQLRQYEECEQILAELVAERPGDADLAARHALMLSMLGRPDDAVAAFRRAIALDPDDGVRRLQLADYLYRLERREEALHELDEHIRRNPEAAKAIFLRGKLLLESGQRDQARAELERALQMRPSMSDAYAVLTHICLEEKDEEAAKRWLRKGLEHVPDASPLANSLAWILATQSEPTPDDAREALRLAEQACEASEHHNIGYLDTLAAAHASSGDFEQAAKWQREAIRLAEEAGMESAATEPYRERLAGYENGRRYIDPRE